MVRQFWKWFDKVAEAHDKSLIKIAVAPGGIPLVVWIAFLIYIYALITRPHL